MHICCRTGQQIFLKFEIFLGKLLLPSSQLIIDGQRHAFLELIIVIARNSDHVPRNLEPQRNIKVFGDMALGPICNESLLFLDADRLNSFSTSDSRFRNQTKSG
jgi:hypothetical protein